LLFLYHINNMDYHELVEPVTIGRTTGQIICAQDGRMSGKHAEIFTESVDGQEHVYIQDLGSKNHTIINRVEIPAHQKTKIKVYSFVEIGDQKFVITESNTANIQELNDMVSKQLAKTLVKLAPNEVLSAPELIPEVHPFEVVQRNEARIQQIQKEILALEQTAKSELLRLEDEKVKLITKAKAKKAELSQIMIVLKTEVDEKNAEMAKMKVELEQKKKKIINLKDLPSDSTEEFPE
jgi:hypothetical protein